MTKQLKKRKSAKELGFPIDVLKKSIFPARETKSEEELRLIREGNRCSAAGIRAAESMRRDSKIKKGYLYFEGRRLTSERLREAQFVSYNWILA